MDETSMTRHGPDADAAPHRVVAASVELEFGSSTAWCLRRRARKCALDDVGLNAIAVAEPSPFPDGFLFFCTITRMATSSVGWPPTFCNRRRRR